MAHRNFVDLPNRKRWWFNLQTVSPFTLESQLSLQLFSLPSLRHIFVFENCHVRERSSLESAGLLIGAAGRAALCRPSVGRASYRRGWSFLGGEWWRILFCDLWVFSANFALWNWTISPIYGIDFRCTCQWKKPWFYKHPRNPMENLTLFWSISLGGLKKITETLWTVFDWGILKSNNQLVPMFITHDGSMVLVEKC